jgi:hypothetical protein
MEPCTINVNGDSSTISEGWGGPNLCGNGFHCGLLEYAIVLLKIVVE